MLRGLFVGSLLFGGTVSAFTRDRFDSVSNVGACRDQCRASCGAECVGIVP